MNVKLSIVFGTYNRYDMVVGLIESIRQHVETPYEIVIADGGSTDGTREWLVEQPDVVMIGERKLYGAVDAYNKAFSIAAGEFVAHLNDDCLLVDDSLDMACAMLENDKEIGQVAIPFVERERPILNYIHLGGKDYLYANFGVVRRALGESVGWWGDYLHTYGGDCELSLNIMRAGYKVVPLRGKYIYHYRAQNGPRRENAESMKFFVKWKNGLADV